MEVEAGVVSHHGTQQARGASGYRATVPLLKALIGHTNRQPSVVCGGLGCCVTTRIRSTHKFATPILDAHAFAVPFPWLIRSAFIVQTFQKPGAKHSHSATGLLPVTGAVPVANDK